MEIGLSRHQALGQQVWIVVKLPGGFKYALACPWTDSGALGVVDYKRYCGVRDTGQLANFF